MPKRLSYVGQTFGRLKVIKDGPDFFYAGMNRRRYISGSTCVCDCGKEVNVRNHELTSGGTRSCGCLMMDVCRVVHKTHGKSYTKLHRVWCAIIQRCTNPNCKAYKNYGARGITICERWRNSFEAFAEDMGPGKKGWTIERVVNDGNYEPGNCVWATRVRQARNKRDNRIITVNGKTDCLAALCEFFKSDYRRVYMRLRLGWPPERAFFDPKDTKLRQAKT